MPHSLRVKLKNLQRKGELTDKDIDRIFKALEQEPCDDAISRDAVWDVMQELWGTSGELIDRLMALPSVNPQEPSGDAISRQAVLDIINFEDKWLLDAKGHNADTKIAFSGMKSKVAELPPVNPQPKTGHWSHDGSHWKNRFICSECNYKLIDELTNYCPNCGAKMQEIPTD